MCIYPTTRDGAEGYFNDFIFWTEELSWNEYEAPVKKE